MSLATEQNSDYIDKRFMQAWILRRLEFFLVFLKFALFNQDILGVSKNQFNPLSANPTKWSNTLKQFVSKHTI